MLSLLQYHRLEDNEPLQVPPSVLYPTQFIVQRPNKPSPDLPAWRVLSARSHNREVTPPPLPHHVVRYSPVEVVAGVGVQPVPVIDGNYQVITLFSMW